MSAVAELIVLLLCVTMNAFDAVEITVLLALTFYQVLVSEHLPESSEGVPVIGQSDLTAFR